MCVCLDGPHPIVLSIHVCTRLPSVCAVVLLQRIKRELGGNISKGCRCGETRSCFFFLEHANRRRKKKVVIFVFVSFRVLFWNFALASRTPSCESKDLLHYDSTCDGFQVDRHHVAFSTVPFTRGDEYGSLTVWHTHSRVSTLGRCGRHFDSMR